MTITGCETTTGNFGTENTSNPTDLTNADRPYQMPETPYFDIIYQTTGNRYTVSENKEIDFSYDYGKYKSAFLFEKDMVSNDTANGYPTYGIFVSSQKTAVAYIAKDKQSIQIKYSDDMGTTWNDSEPILPSHDYYVFPHPDITEFPNYIVDFEGVVDLFIDFPTPDCGYILICGGTSMSTQNTRDMFKTTDGGKTWNYIKSNIEDGGPPIQSMYFANSNTGYLGSFCGAAASSYIQRTADGGITWTDITFTDTDDNGSMLNIPGKHAYGCPLPQMPYFIDNKGYLPVITQAYPIDLSMVIFFTSDDNGITWVYNPAWDTPLSDYSQPVALPGCSKPPIIGNN